LMIDFLNVDRSEEIAFRYLVEYID